MREIREIITTNPPHYHRKAIVINPNYDLISDDDDEDNDGELVIDESVRGVEEGLDDNNVQGLTTSTRMWAGGKCETFSNHVAVPFPSSSSSTASSSTSSSSAPALLYPEVQVGMLMGNFHHHHCIQNLQSQSNSNSNAPGVIVHPTTSSSSTIQLQPLASLSLQSLSLGRAHVIVPNNNAGVTGNNSLETTNNFPASRVVVTGSIWTPASISSSTSTSTTTASSTVKFQPVYEDISNPPSPEVNYTEMSATTATTSANLYAANSSSTPFHHLNLLHNSSKGGEDEANQQQQSTSSAEEPPSSSPLPHLHFHHQTFNTNSTSKPTPVPVDVIIKNASFTQDKVDSLCDVMIRERKYTMLEKFVKGLGKNVRESENVMRARAALAFQKKDYKKLYFILDSRMFDSVNHLELQRLFLEAKYQEAIQVRAKEDKPLGAVDKYRIRKKCPFPRTIWDGEATSYTFKESARQLLVTAYLENEFPNAEKKKELERDTHLSKRQIENWFKNRRQRDRSKDEQLPAQNQSMPKPRGGKGGKRVKMMNTSPTTSSLTPSTSNPVVVAVGEGSGGSSLYEDVPSLRMYGEGHNNEGGVDSLYCFPSVPTSAQIKAYPSGGGDDAAIKTPPVRRPYSKRGFSTSSWGGMKRGGGVRRRGIGGGRGRGRGRGRKATSTTVTPLPPLLPHNHHHDLYHHQQQAHHYSDLMAYSSAVAAVAAMSRNLRGSSGSPPSSSEPMMTLPLPLGEIKGESLEDEDGSGGHQVVVELMEGMGQGEEEENDEDNNNKQNMIPGGYHHLHHLHHHQCVSPPYVSPPSYHSNGSPTTMGLGGWTPSVWDHHHQSPSSPPYHHQGGGGPMQILPSLATSFGNHNSSSNIGHHIHPHHHHHFQNHHPYHHPHHHHPPHHHHHHHHVAAHHHHLQHALSGGEARIPVQ